MLSSLPKSLIIYSSPDTQDRLRLDREHKVIDEVLSKHRLPAFIIKRIHAATLWDVAAALREQDYEAVQFSCHGNEIGLCLEGKTTDEIITWEQLSSTLRQSVPNLSVIILNACYSVSAESKLHSVAPFLILIDGEADDAAAIDFIKNFFDEYYRLSGIERAFRYATSSIEAMGLGDKIKPVLTRKSPSGDSVIQACFIHRHDSIFIDLSQAEKSISQLPISRHDFFSLLTRKIRVHGWIFKVPREHAILPIGQYYGVFSWENANNIVICHHVLQLRPDIAIDDCAAWMRLVVIYNDLRSQRYRVIENPSAPENKPFLQDAKKLIKTYYDNTLTSNDVMSVSKSLVSQQYTVTISTVQVQLEVASRFLDSTDFSRVVIALETAISSIHDLVDQLTSQVSLKSTPP